MFLAIGIPLGLYITDTDPFEEFDKVECYKLQKASRRLQELHL